MLRNALALSIITREPFEMDNIRGSRPNPGLKRQHLEAVRAAARLSRARTEGVEDGSESIVFRPQTLVAENFTVNIGTAGSTTLLLDTILPVTTQLDDSLRIDVKGGTDVKWSPTASYYRDVKIPLLEKFDLDAEVEVEKTGFYPSGGGSLRLETGPYSMDRIDLERRGDLERFELHSKASRDLEGQDVADRQASEAERKLKNSHISVPVEKQVSYENTASTGSLLCLKAVYEDSIAGFDALGEQGKRAEKVAREVVKQFKSFHASNAAADRYMADQLVVFLAVAGGEVRIEELTDHVQTSLEVVKKFGREVDMERVDGEVVLRR